MAVMEVTGQEGMYFRQIVGSLATGANPTLTFPLATNSSNAVMVGIGLNRASPAGTPPSGWTEMCDSGHATPNAGAIFAYKVQGVNTTTVVYSAATGNYGIIGLEVWQAGAVPMEENGCCGQLGLVGVGL